MAQHIHRIPRSDGDELVLLNITASKSRTLDLEIEGTDSEVPFFAAFKHSHLTSSLSSSANLTPDVWETLLPCLLLQTRPPDTTTAEILSTIELTASISPHPTRKSSHQLTLAFRRNIAGIHQRLAELVLPQQDDRELDTLAWVAASCQRADALELEARKLNERAETRDREVREMAKQLEELVRAKETMEEEMLGRFARVLNGKKGKVRDLLRVLEGSRVDEGKANAVGKSRNHAARTSKSAGDGAGATRKFATSIRTRKRKPAAQESPDDSDEFESMQGVQRGKQQQADADGEGSNQRDEDDETTASEQTDQGETTDDGDDDDDDALGAAQPLGRNTETKDNTDTTAAATAQEKDDDEPLAPKRELPFAVKDKGMNKKATATAKIAEKPTTSPKKGATKVEAKAQDMDVDKDAETDTDDEL